jgi:hypothetical protein
MVSGIPTYASAAIAVGWGVACLAPTRAVVSGFGELAAGNRLILTMEWVSEGVTLIFVGVLVAVVGSVGAATDQLATAIKGLAAGMLVAMAVLTATTGARSDVVFSRSAPQSKGSRLCCCSRAL